jgi:hypothetical protein
VKYREDFFHLVKRLVNDGAIAFTLSLLFLPLKYKWKEEKIRSHEEKKKRILSETKENISWRQLTARFPSYSDK